MEQLKFYAGKFNTVEINYTFYHIPKTETFKKWEQTVPPDFLFSIKLNRQFTHNGTLDLNNELLLKLNKFLQNASQLDKKFAVLLVQTPKSLEFNIDSLENFLKTISLMLQGLKFPPRLAFEFRNEQWFNQETYSLLKKYNAALVISQSPNFPEMLEVVSNLIYIRFHGPDKIFDSSYSNEQLKGWKAFIDQHIEVKEIYIYFNNTMRGQALDNARYFQKLFYL